MDNGSGDGPQALRRRGGEVRVRAFLPSDFDLSSVRREFLCVTRSLAARGLPACERSRAETLQVIEDSLPDGDAFPACSLVALVVVRIGSEHAARVALFRHEAEPGTGWLGLFECDGRQEAADAAFRKATGIAEAQGMTRLAGPMDGTPWDRWRYKVEGFAEDPYLGEPTNPEGYPAIWEAAGFSVCRTWHSDAIPQVAAAGPDKMASRLRRALDLGYSFRSVSAMSFRHDMSEVHRILDGLYEGTPSYVPIPFQDFLVRAWPLRVGADRRSTLLAIDSEGEVAGFMLAIPDYGSVRGSGIARALGIARMRLRPSRYVILHMGVARGHEGLGGAMAAVMRRRMAEARVTGVAALVPEGRTPGAYLGVLSARRAYRYVLYERPVDAAGPVAPDSAAESAEDSQLA